LPGAGPARLEKATTGTRTCIFQPSRK